jgi:hypothetical protein
MASPLLEGLGNIPWAQVVATNDGWRATALTVVQGLPLAALAGLEECATAYHAVDPESLQADPNWADLPNPVEGIAPADLPGRVDEASGEGFLQDV